VFNYQLHVFSVGGTREIGIVSVNFELLTMPKMVEIIKKL